MRLRGKEYDVEKELREIVEKKQKKQQGGERSVLKSIFSKEFLLPFVKIGILMSLSQWAGINILSSYLVTVFEVQTHFFYLIFISSKGIWIKPRPIVGPNHGLCHPARPQHPLLLRAQVQLDKLCAQVQLDKNHCLIVWSRFSPRKPLFLACASAICLGEATLATHHHLTRFTFQPTTRLVFLSLPIRSSTIVFASSGGCQSLKLSMVGFRC